MDGDSLIIPHISILIPTFNRASSLGITIDALCRSKHIDVPWEIIVIDNNSNDDTRRVVEKYVDVLPIKYLFEASQGKNYALNTGIKASSGRILVFIDDDITVRDNWLIEIANSVDRWPEAMLFGGMILPSYPSGTPDWIKQSEYSSFVLGLHIPVLPEGYYSNSMTPVGGNCWLRREIFDAGNYFDTGIGPSGSGRKSGSELEFFNRLEDIGLGSVYIPSSIVEHRIETNRVKIRYFLKRSFQSGKGFGYINNEYLGKKLCHVPRYLFRQILENTLRLVMALLLFNVGEAFENAMIISHRLGCIMEYWQNHGVRKLDVAS